MGGNPLLKGDVIMIAVIDYGAGNIFSIINALDYLGCKSVLTGDKRVV